MDIVRAGIQALSDGSVVLPTPIFVRQQPNDVRQILSDSLLEARITEMLTRKTEPILAELAGIKTSQADAIERAGIAELRTELLGELAAWPITTKPITTKRNRERQQLQQTQEELKQTQEGSPA